VLAGVGSPQAQGALIAYEANLSGPAESPANASPGTGFAQVDIDVVAHTLRVRAIFGGLLGTTTASHVHAATAVPGVSTAGVATQTPTFSGFPLGVTSGSYDMTFDTSLASSWNAPYITNNGGTPLSAEAAFATALADGKAYLNIHSSAFGGGEIRGFLHPVPAPGAAALLALGGLAATRRRRN
jgi:MYXO-CTERM domain-containing protein